MKRNSFHLETVENPWHYSPFKWTHSALGGIAEFPPEASNPNYVISTREIPESSFTVCTCGKPDALEHHD